LGKAEKGALTRAVSWDQEERWVSVAKFCQELRRHRQQPTPGEERVNEKDGTVLVYVPGGEYTLGADDIGDWARPVHRVRLSPFWIGKYPVTNEQYAEFLAANPEQRTLPLRAAGERFCQPRQPVVGGTWHEAQAYCRWAGLQLPSEAQWEAAARAGDGRRYPWGNEPPVSAHANFDQNEGKKTTAVGSYPDGAGPFATLDQAGNVWEWCVDIWNPEAYHERDGQVDPVGTTGIAPYRVLRGGSWANSSGYLAAAFRIRYDATTRDRFIGFRCLLPVSPEL
jgi:formylglycine-generating enzyme required for sulfatase activity